MTIHSMFITMVMITAAYYYDYDYYASTDPRVFYTQFDEFERSSNEFRIQSVTDSGYQWIFRSIS